MSSFPPLYYFVLWLRSSIPEELCFWFVRLPVRTCVRVCGCSPSQLPSTFSFYSVLHFHLSILIAVILHCEFYCTSPAYSCKTFKWTSCLGLPCLGSRLVDAEWMRFVGGCCQWIHDVATRLGTSVGLQSKTFSILPKSCLLGTWRGVEYLWRYVRT